MNIFYLTLYILCDTILFMNYVGVRKSIIKTSPHQQHISQICVCLHHTAGEGVIDTGGVYVELSFVALSYVELGSVEFCCVELS